MSGKTIDKVIEMFKTAMLEADMDKAQYLVRHFPQVLYAMIEESHAILHTPSGEWTNMLYALVEGKADLNMKMVSRSGIKDFTFLHAAANDLDALAVEILLSNGAEFHEAAGGITPMHCVVASGKRKAEVLDIVRAWDDGRLAVIRTLLLGDAKCQQYTMNSIDSIIEAAKATGSDYYAELVVDVINKCSDPDYCFHCYSSPCICYIGERSRRTNYCEGDTKKCKVVENLLDYINKLRNTITGGDSEPKSAIGSINVIENDESQEQVGPKATQESPSVSTKEPEINGEEN